MKKPSVTQLLDLLAKPALIAWANRQGLQGIDIRQRRKADLDAGRSIHEQIETGTFDREEDSARFAEFTRSKTILASEQKIETEWFVGRYDVLLSDGAAKYIADYKSGFRGTVYLEHKLQLIAYTMAVPAEMAVVGVPDFSFCPVRIKNRSPYERMLRRLSDVWYLMQEIEGKPVSS
jgi:hypothetical protein